LYVIILPEKNDKELASLAQSARHSTFFLQDVLHSGGTQDDLIWWQKSSSTTREIEEDFCHQMRSSWVPPECSTSWRKNAQGGIEPGVA